MNNADNSGLIYNVQSLFEVNVICISDVENFATPWNTLIKFKPNSASVSFQPAPSHFGFSTYSLSVIDEHGDIKHNKDIFTGNIEVILFSHCLYIHALSAIKVELELYIHQNRINSYFASKRFSQFVTDEIPDFFPQAVATIVLIQP